MDIKELLKELIDAGVHSFEGEGIKVVFKELKHTHYAQSPPQSTQEPVEPSPAMAQSMDAEMPYDEILNWSGTPDSTPSEIPLTGDSASLTS